MDHKLKVFDGEEYSIWKYRMTHLLKKEGLWEMIEGTGDEDTDEEAKDKKGKSKEEVELRRKKKRLEEKAHALIVLHISDEQNSHIMNCTNARSAWTKLEQANQAGNVTNTTILRRKLTGTKMPENGDLRKHIYELRKITRQLQDCGVSIGDDELTAALLNSLPKRYEIPIALIQQKKNITFDKVVLRLTAEDIRTGEYDEKWRRQKPAKLYMLNLPSHYKIWPANSVCFVNGITTR